MIAHVMSDEGLPLVAVIENLNQPAVWNGLGDPSYHHRESFLVFEIEKGASVQRVQYLGEKRAEVHLLANILVKFALALLDLPSVPPFVVVGRLAASC